MTGWQWAFVLVVVFLAGYFLGRAQVAAAWNLADENRSRRSALLEEERRRRLPGNTEPFREGDPF